MRILLCSALCLAIVGCSSPNTQRKLKEREIDRNALKLAFGMSKKEALNIMGEPTRKLSKGKIEAYVYNYGASNLGDCRFIVFDENGKLSSSKINSTCSLLLDVDKY